MNNRDYLQFTKYLISTNSELIEKTAISNCHCMGLNSFIINEKPKIRLFVADSNCELFRKYDSANPRIPIHPHKYDDLFVQLEGKMTHHIYQISDDGQIFKKYHYYRLSDGEAKIEKIGTEKLSRVYYCKTLTNLRSDALHSVSLIGPFWKLISVKILPPSSFVNTSSIFVI